MQAGDTIKIKSVSRKGFNKINEGLGDSVVILMFNHPSNPPAILVAPNSSPTMQAEKIRWIKLDNDPDFEILGD